MKLCFKVIFPHVMLFISWHKILSDTNAVRGITVLDNTSDINLSCLFLEAYKSFCLGQEKSLMTNRIQWLFWILKNKEIYSLVLFRSLSGITQGHLHMCYIVLYFFICQHIIFWQILLIILPACYLIGINSLQFLLQLENPSWNKLFSSVCS